jgi:molybdopterin-guanine dinucleotide biosynthesis protein A
MMSAEFYLLSVPVQCGKTTLLESWVQTQPQGSVGGCLSPDRVSDDGRKTRVFWDVQTATEVPFEWAAQEEIDSNDLLEIGRFRFRQSGFDWVQHRMKEWSGNQSLQTLIIDEVGPLELRLNSGMEPGLSGFIDEMKQPGQAGRRVLFVVRDYLLEDFLARYELKECIVNQGPWFPKRMEVEGLLLMGGQSSRMGSDKSQLDYHGQPQYRYALSQLHRALERPASCWLSAAEGQDLVLEEREIRVHDAPVFAGHGPISGVLSAHVMASQKALLVLGVDYPYLKDYALSRLVSAYRVSGRSVCFAPANPDSKLPKREHLEPLVALYTHSDLQALLLYFNQGGRSLKAFLSQCDALVLPYDEKMGLESIDTLPVKKP